MNNDQIERLEKNRKLPDEGKFLAGEDAYDKRDYELPTGTVPVSDPNARPAEGDVVDDPLEQRATAPEAPVTKPSGVSSGPNALKPDTDAVEQARATDPDH